MVAATFPNLSFENPPGTGPTLVSTLAEPYAFQDGDTLEISFAGETSVVVFLSTDFSDIAAATADEVAALLELRVDDLGVSNDAGFVRLTSLLTGEDVTLEVVSGTANVQLGFAAGAVTGETYAGGPPDGWTVSTDADSVTEFAEWSDENGRPEEFFDVDGWLALVVTGTFTDALFDVLIVPTPFETFTAWSTTGLLTSISSVSATFGQGLEEDFETLWGSPVYFVFLPVHLQDGAVNPETFETGWLNGSVGAVGPDADFAGATATVEDFENVDITWYTMTLTTALVAGRWTIKINGVSHFYDALGGDDIVDVASGLQAAVDSGSVTVIISQLFFVLSISPVDTDTDIAISVDSPSGTAFDLIPAADNPSYVTRWVGQDTNPDFD